MSTGRNGEKIVIIGAGIGGLTTAALLARAGLDVTLLEAHVYPGGCAGTFYHQKYNFDAGATLAGGFYPGGPMDIVANAVGIARWPAHASELAMMVHLPNGQRVARRGSDERWGKRGLRVANALLAQMDREPARTGEHPTLLTQLSRS